MTQQKMAYLDEYLSEEDIKYFDDIMKSNPRLKIIIVAMIEAAWNGGYCVGWDECEEVYARRSKCVSCGKG